MNLRDARETVDSHLRWLCNRPESWQSTPLPENVQEALCLLMLDLTDDKGAGDALGDVFHDMIITPETPSGTGDGL